MDPIFTVPRRTMIRSENVVAKQLVCKATIVFFFVFLYLY